MQRAVLLTFCLPQTEGRIPDQDDGENPRREQVRILLVAGRRLPEDDWSAEREAVRRVWLESDRRFGFRFVKCLLPAEFSGLTLYRVRKLMRELGIRGCTPNAEKRTTIPDPNAKPRPDLVRRDFTSSVPTYKLVGDITCLRTGEGWLYLSTVIDLNTRMAVGVFVNHETGISLCRFSTLR